MAKTNAKEEVVAVEEPAATEVAKVVESVYSAEELAKNYRAFNTSHEIVVVALKLAKKETATFAEAKAIIEKFKNREVK